MYGYRACRSNKEINTLFKRDGLSLNMRFILLISLIYLISTAEKCTPRVGPHIKFDTDSCIVTVKVTVTTPYCGGPRPTEEVLELTRKPRPLISQTFYVKEGMTNSLQLPEI